MAATLAHLKSRELVPPDPAELAAELDADAAAEAEIDPRQELIRRLLEYQKYKDAAHSLGGRPVTGRNVWHRGSRMEDVVGLHALPGGAPLAEVPVFQLIESLERVLSRAKIGATHDVVVEHVSITERINELVDRLEREGTFTFESLLRLRRGRWLAPAAAPRGGGDLPRHPRDDAAQDGAAGAAGDGERGPRRARRHLRDARRRRPARAGRGPGAEGRRVRRMSKKRKKHGKPQPETDALDVPETANADSVGLADAHAAVSELEESAPTRTGRALEELGQHTPTRAGRQLDDADAAAAELADEEAARTSLRTPRLVDSGDKSGASSADAPPHATDEPSDDHRFDFGSEQGSARLEVPPDPGSADAASPRLQSIVESLLFAADRPLDLRQLADLRRGAGGGAHPQPRCAASRRAGASAASSCTRSPAASSSAPTRPTPSGCRSSSQQKPVRLSRALLETLAICAYRQPITRPEIDEIRGVDSGGTLKTLIDRALVRILGKKEEPGRPMLYGTTKEFLEFFNLRDLKDLPTLREYPRALRGASGAGRRARGEGAGGHHRGRGRARWRGRPPRTTAPRPCPSSPASRSSYPRKTPRSSPRSIRLIRTAGTGIPSTDSDLPLDAESLGDAPDELVATGRFQPLSRPPSREASVEFDERARAHRASTATHSSMTSSAA